MQRMPESQGWFHLFMPMKIVHKADCGTELFCVSEVCGVCRRLLGCGRARERRLWLHAREDDPHAQLGGVCRRAPRELRLGCGEQATFHRACRAEGEVSGSCALIPGEAEQRRLCQAGGCLPEAGGARASRVRGEKDVLRAFCLERDEAQGRCGHCHTRTHMHARTHARTHTRTHARARSPTHAH